MSQVLVWALLLTPQQAPVVAGFDRFETLDAVEGGRLLLGELGCVSCHAGPDLAARQGPALGDVGGRLRADWLRAWLADPAATKPGTTMPQVAGKDAVEPLVHYLMSLGAAKPVELAAGAPGKGADLFHTAGCVACHAPLAGPPKGDRAVVPLPKLEDKWRSAAALAAFLHDPLKWRPSGRMPKLNLTPAEAMSLAARLVGLPPRAADDPPGPFEPGLAWEAYHGSWSKLPDFDALQPASSGVGGFDPKLAKREDGFALRWRGYLDVTADGAYGFFLSSDDGSRLWIGNTLVVDHDGVHGGSEVGGTIQLKKGKHAITVAYFEAGGGEELSVSWEGPGFGKRRLDGRPLSRSASGELRIVPAGPPGAAFAPDAALVARGRDLFQSLRCASCHVAEPGLKSPTAKPLAALSKAACAPAKYGLSARQASAIEKALAAPPKESTPALRIERTLAALNCFACHERGGKGGVEPGRNPFFAGTDQTIGDEGRLPPHLDGVGAKLRREFLKSVLETGVKVRPYVLARMPSFGAANVAHLTDDFEKVDGAVAEPPLVRDAELAKAGRQLLGTKGMSCVSCHGFQGHKSLGIAGMDLVNMTQRLRRAWFDRYLLEPSSLRPGTRMPTFWPEGRSVRKDILDGDTPRQFEALWQYLAEGSKARLPIGVGPQPILLVPAAEPVIYRNFIQGAGTRAIGVGYPERVNLAFDANQMCLKLLWRGDFIDASRHWVDRGAGFQGPAGDDVLSLPDGPPFAVLADAKSAWPKESGKAAGWQFKGYELDAKGRPAFLYALKGVEVRDHFEPSGKGFKRTVTLDAKEAPSGLFFRAGKEVRPVAFENGRATLVVDYAW